MMVYGPPAVTLRFTRYRVAPRALGHVSITRVSLPTALRVAGAGGGAIHEWMALLTLSRPPLIVSNAIDAIGSTDPTITSFNCSVFIRQCDRTSAAAPDTWGAAIDVPLIYA